MGKKYYSPWKIGEANEITERKRKLLCDAISTVKHHIESNGCDNKTIFALRGLCSMSLIQAEAYGVLDDLVELLRLCRKEG